MQLTGRFSAALVMIFLSFMYLPMGSDARGGEDKYAVESATGDCGNPESGSNNTQTSKEILPIKYWGNLFSLKFHRPSCPFAKAMSAHNVVFFNFRKQAIDSGQVPCRYCLPPTWNTVHAQVLNPSALKSTPSSGSTQTVLMPEDPLPVPEKDSLQHEITVTH